MRALLDLVFPPRCPLCRTVVSHTTTACADCWQQLNFISPPFCWQCGLPFETSDSEEDASLLKCISCLEAPSAFSSARSAYVYDAASKKMVLSFKHGSAFHLLPFLTQALVTAGQAFFKEVDLLVPVPLHWRRIYKRGFNQSALLAQHLGKALKKEVDISSLKKIKNTLSQGELSLEERQKNVATCFQITSPSKIKNKSILLIDDVMTTGATLNACAKILLKEGGAKDVKALCVARVQHIQ
jgi:ComF family protein